MKITFVVPGVGGNFYCENCLRDSALVVALDQGDCDVTVAPLYLPTNLAAGNARTSDIFFGGVNVFLQQKLSLFRKTPRWVDRFFDNQRLLGWLARNADMTNAKDLGDTTLSMLRGEHGRQVKELNRLVDWLGSQGKPDVVCLSNALLVGFARAIKQKLKVPVACLLQDEDEFIDILPSGQDQQVYELMSLRGRDVDVFIAGSEYFGRLMEARLKLDPGSVKIVYPGLTCEDYTPADSIPQGGVIGFLSRMCPEKGLETLVEAFIKLKKDDRFGKIRLRIAGGQTKADGAFIDKLRGRLRDAGVIGDVDFIGDCGHSERLEFLRSLTVLSVPQKRGSACGFFALEALASGVPVVLPDNGAFPEYQKVIGKSIQLFDPNSPEELVKTLEPFLLDSDYAHQLGREGREIIKDKFAARNAADQLIGLFSTTARLIFDHTAHNFLVC